MSPFTQGLEWVYINFLVNLCADETPKPASNPKEPALRRQLLALAWRFDQQSRMRVILLNPKVHSTCHTIYAIWSRVLCPGSQVAA